MIDHSPASAGLFHGGSMARLPRGIRNRNPLNIELGAPWKGLSGRQTDGRFAQFDSHLHGIRAAARVLRNYQRLHGLRTVRQVIGRWAPPVENDTGSYARAVASAMGVGLDQDIDLADAALMTDMIQAMAVHENGPAGAATLALLYPEGAPAGLRPGHWYPRDQVLAGIALA